MRSILIFETSTEAASIALVLDGRIVTEKSFTSDRRHNALLFQPLAEILEEYGRPHFDAVFVGSGPGSYSGTRVGIAAAQGAALVAGCKTVAVPSILATHEALSGAECLAVGDARRGSFWLAKISEGTIQQGPELTDSIGFQVALEAASASAVTVYCTEPIRGMGIPLARPTAAGIWHVWNNTSPKTRAFWAGKTPQPIYLATPHITPSKKEIFGKS